MHARKAAKVAIAAIKHRESEGGGK